MGDMSLKCQHANLAAYCPLCLAEKIERGDMKLFERENKDQPVDGHDLTCEEAMIVAALSARPEVAQWEHAPDGQWRDRAIHALPGTQWTFWIEVNGVMYKHEHVLPPFNPSLEPQSQEEKP